MNVSLNNELESLKKEKSSSSLNTPNKISFKSTENMLKFYKTLNKKAYVDDPNLIDAATLPCGLIGLEEVVEEQYKVENDYDELRDDENPEKKAKVEIEFEDLTFKTMLSAVFSVCNCIIRYTVLEIALCYAVLGLLYGTIIIICVSLMNIFTTYFVLKVYERTGDK